MKTRWDGDRLSDSDDDGDDDYVDSRPAEVIQYLTSVLVVYLPPEL